MRLNNPMHIQMPVMTAFLRELATTQSALKRLLPAVYENVSLVGRGPLESTPTNLADVFLFAHSESFMGGFHVAV